MEELKKPKKERRAGIADILRSPYARGFLKKYKWTYLAGMLILVIIAMIGCITIPGINTSLFDPGLSY